MKYIIFSLSLSIFGTQNRVNGRFLMIYGCYKPGCFSTTNLPGSQPGMLISQSHLTLTLK